MRVRPRAPRQASRAAAGSSRFLAARTSRPSNRRTEPTGADVVLGVLIKRTGLGLEIAELPSRLPREQFDEARERDHREDSLWHKESLGRTAGKCARMGAAGARQ